MNVAMLAEKDLHASNKITDRRKRKRFLITGKILVGPLVRKAGGGLHGWIAWAFEG